MAALLLLYVALVGWRAVQFVLTGEPVAVTMGIALIVLPLIAVWALGRELLFGIRSERLLARLENEHAVPDEELPVRPSGRPERAAADAAFAAYAAAAEGSDDWRAWMRLGLAYDGAGDRRRARAAVRRAIELDRRR
jgi:hypothetical protein